MSWNIEEKILFIYSTISIATTNDVMRNAGWETLL
jgi:hypothetical protein